MLSGRRLIDFTYPTEAVEPKPVSTTRRALLRGALGAGCATFAGGLWESDTVHLRRQTLYLPKWNVDGFRLAFVSDLHVDSSPNLRRAQTAIEMAQRARPDLIVIGGDFINGNEHASAPHLRSFAERLDASHCPIIAILGNHDMLAPSSVVTGYLKDYPVKVLENEIYEFQGIHFIGLADQLLGSPKPDLLHTPGLSRSLVCLWHEPDMVDVVPEQISLQLSGHSHGGEVCLPGGIPLHTPDLAKKYTGGFYGRTSAPLYVSKGVATLSGLRVYCPPEISILTLRSSGGAPARMV